MTWKKSIQGSLKAYILNNVIPLDREQWNRTIKNIFIGQGNPLFCIKKVFRETMYQSNNF